MWGEVEVFGEKGEGCGGELRKGGVGVVRGREGAVDWWGKGGE